jgi:hypothetical protein
LEWILRLSLFLPLSTIFPTGLSHDRN